MTGGSVQLTAFANLVTGLQSALGLTASRCFEVAKAGDIPTIPPGNDTFCTVSWGDSTWTQGEQFVSQLTEDPAITVTLYTRLKSDQSGHDTFVLRDLKAGLFPFRDAVIRALVQKTLCTSARETIKVRLSTGGEIIKNTRDGTFMGMMHIQFAAPYDVDILDG